MLQFVVEILSMDRRSRVWTGAEAFLVGFVIFKLAYVPFELAFNAQLIDVASSGASLDAIHGLEFYGRAISSLALALAYMRMRMGRVKLSSRLFVVACALFLVSFFAQKVLILSVVKHSSGDERHIALLLNFLPAAVRHTHVEGFDFNNYDTPESKTFLAEAGSMLFFSKSTHASIDQQLDNLIRGDLIEKTLADDNKNAWQIYRKIGEEVVESYKKYGDFRKLAHEKGTSTEDAEKQLSDLIDSAKQTWHSTNARLSAATQPAEIAKAIQDLEYYFYHRNKPNAQTEYHRRMLELFGTDVEDTYWCSNLQCPVDQAFLPDRIKKLLAKRSIRETGTDPFQPFSINSAATATFIRKAAERQGVHLPESWTADDRSTFVAVVKKTSRQKLNDAVDGELSKTLGESLWKDMNFAEFEKLLAVQEKIRDAVTQKVSLAHVKGPLSAIWDRKDFEQRVIVPSIEEELRKIRAEKIGSSASYEDDGIRGKIGRDAVKRIILPPISLSLSSFFALFNIVSLLTLVVGLFSKRVERKSYLILCTAVLVIFATPFMGNVGLAKYDGYTYVTETSAKYAPVVTKLISWNVRLQPVLYPFATWTRNHTVGENFFLISDMVYEKLDALDHAIIDRIL